MACQKQAACTCRWSTRTSSASSWAAVSASSARPRRPHSSAPVPRDRGMQYHSPPPPDGRLHLSKRTEVAEGERGLEEASPHERDVHQRGLRPTKWLRTCWTDDVSRTVRKAPCKPAHPVRFGPSARDCQNRRAIVDGIGLPRDATSRAVLLACSLGGARTQTQRNHPLHCEEIQLTRSMLPTSTNALTQAVVLPSV